MAASPADAQLTALIYNRDFHGAAQQLLSIHGDEIFAFLVHHVGDESRAADVFSQAVEDLWVGLPRFEQRCSARTWLYVLARNAATRHGRARVAREQTGPAQLLELAASVRTRTPPWQRSDVKDKFRQLREQLEPDDRSLLALRIDCELEWEEIARVFLGDTDPSAEALKTESARLRKRLQTLKAELRKRAIEAGLLEIDS